MFELIVSSLNDGNLKLVVLKSKLKLTFELIYAQLW